MTHDKGERLWVLKSPDERVLVEIRHAEGTLSYRVRLDAITMLEWSPLGIFTSVADFRDHLRCVGETWAQVNETYAMVAGKTSHAVNHYHELTLKFVRHRYEMRLIIRAYTDAVAYRYEIGGEGSLRVYEESSGFQLAEASSAVSWAQIVSANYEEFYAERQGMLVGAYNMPVLFRHGEGAWMLLSEAAVYGHYSGSHLVSHESQAGLLRIAFAPDQVNPLETSRPLVTPWRVAILGRELSHVFASTVIENLNPACEIMDTTWIRPGRVYWSWWAGEPQDRLDVQKKYVDFAAQMGWEYFLCDAGWQMAWLPELIDYAHARRVDILVWTHHRDLVTDDEREEKLDRWARLGISGVKVDFFDSDCQERIRLYDALAQETARHHLLLNYHGATKPSGERRRWPHLLTREGIYGAEYYRNHDGPTAEHNCTVPFTRNVVGPMDYTPVTYSKAHGKTTMAHQLALPVIFESNLQHLSESVEGFRDYGEPALEFLRACPSTWDVSCLVEGYPGKLVVIARRRGRVWFVGAISAQSTLLTVEVSLDFLGEGTYQVRRYQDSEDGRRIVTDQHTVTPTMTVDVTLLASGGAVLWLEPN